METLCRPGTPQSTKSVSKKYTKGQLVALGTKNAKVQKKVDAIDGEIAAIFKQIVEPEDKAMENLFTKAKKAKKEFDDHNKEIVQFVMQQMNVPRIIGHWLDSIVMVLKPEIIVIDLK